MTYAPKDFEVTESISAAQVDIESRVDPPSLQASAATRNGYRAALSSAIAGATSRYFNHDVRVTLNWIIAEKRRYETHVVADLDNVLKPTIDALVGPNGILFDDNQVQSIDASWHTGIDDRDKGFKLRIESLPIGDYVARGGKFVQITPGRCFYVAAARPEHQRTIVETLVMMERVRAEAEAVGFRGEDLYFATPIARSFPRARLARFEVGSPDEFC